MKSNEDKQVHYIEFGAGMTTACGNKITILSNEPQVYNMPFSLQTNYVTCEQCITAYNSKQNKNKQIKWK